MVENKPAKEIPDPHRATVTAIRHATQQGWFTTAQAEFLIDRIRSRKSDPPTTRNGEAARPISPDGTNS